ncbi:flippase [Pseudomonas fluorescens group sp.]|nr:MULTISPECIES: flippase [Pseudomonas fluorescens group]MBZ6456762.1 flippase [Pseudomonas fluorescens group sp.]MBZ6461029.1 flippase [Pseudomonas fluorescens group sp.]MBZ6469131.1 flippase [Pseudomonas fluorescens group sp.]WQD73944.1 flippase [Pseudomonas marginalis]
MSIRNNTVWNLIGTGAPFLLGLITIPYLIKWTGVEMFGVLTLVWILIGYFSLFDFGLGRALTQTVAKKIAEEKIDEVSITINLGLFLVVFAGVCGGVLLGAISHMLGAHWLGVSAELQSDVVISFLIAAAGIPLTTATSGLRGVLEAYQEFGKVNVLRVLLGVANFGAPALTVLILGPELKWMVASLVAARVVVFIAHTYLVGQKSSFFWVSPKKHKAEIRQLITFGSWMTLSNVISPLMVTGDRFVISSMMGASFVAYYTVPFEVLVRFLVIPAALTAAIFPRLSALLVTDMRSAYSLFRKSVMLVAAVMLVFCATAAFGSNFGMTLWLGTEFSEQSAMLASILAIGILFNSVAQIPHSVVQAAGNVKGTAIVHLAEFCIYFPILYLAVRNFGLMGAVVVWVIRAFVDMSLMFLLSRKIFLKQERN